MIDEDYEYEVEAILNMKKEGRRILYLVKWKGYNESHNTWEPLSNLDRGTVKSFE